MRLVTRADLDGLACALILGANERIDELLLVHPQEITDKKVAIGPDDTLANLPYHPGCGRWFDHHLLTPSNEQPPEVFEGLYREAPSAAQLVWEYFGEQREFAAMVAQTNRYDAAQLEESDVLQPQGWILLGFTVDPRTGHSAHETFFRQCLQWLADTSLEEVLLKPEVHQRVVDLFQQNEAFCWQLMHHSRMNGNVVFTDFRATANPPVGNRFLIYTLFPEANVSLRTQFGSSKDGVKDCVMVTAGHSIFNRTCSVSLGNLMSHYGGGGHHGAASAPLPILDADTKILEILAALQDR